MSALAWPFLFLRRARLPISFAIAAWMLASCSNDDQHVGSGDGLDSSVAETDAEREGAAAGSTDESGRPDGTTGAALVRPNGSAADGAMSLGGDEGGVESGTDFTTMPGSNGSGVDSSTDSGDPSCDCAGGVCRGGTCCRGCWDGTTCRSGADSSACGIAGAMCVSCDDGKGCTADKCLANGTCGHDPLTGTSCPTGVCVGDLCHCGGLGEPCCATGTACEGAQTCQDGHCGACGAVGLFCCSGAVSCAAGNTCNSVSECEACGATGQACCPGTVPCGTGSTCNAGMRCELCGGLSQPCCASGSQCGANLSCSGATCQCGGVGQACCDGTVCNDDGDKCNGIEMCQGTCQHVNPVTCTASDACHQVGACSPATGLCSNPTRPDGVDCTDNNACTMGDSCQAGVCVSGAAKACSTGQRCDATTGNCVCDGTSCPTGCCSQSMACQVGTDDGACGGSGLACAECSSAQVCQDHACVACGGVDQPCCHPSNTCGDASLHCDAETTTCSGCGGLGQVCCGAVPCDSFGVCLNQTQCAAKDVWVGGFLGEDDFGPLGGILHWDGLTWTEVDSDLTDIDGIFGTSPLDVWAVGRGGTLGGASDHWQNGLSGLGIPFTYQYPTYDTLPQSLDGLAVWASGPTDVWSVSTDINMPTALVLHSSGTLQSNATLWATARPLNVDSHFFGVWGNGPNDVWTTGTNGTGLGVALHWTTGFAGTPTPFSVGGTASVGAVWSSGTTDGWAVASSSTAQAMAAHYNGTAWTSVTVSGATRLAGVSGASASDVWMVGQNGPVGVAVHFTSFDAQPIVTTVPGTTSLAAVWAAAKKDVWAAGQDANGGVVVHWDGSAWSVYETFSGPNVSLNSVWGVNH